MRTSPRRPAPSTAPGGYWVVAALVLCWLVVGGSPITAATALTIRPGSTSTATDHAFPVLGAVSFGDGHHDYPATDIIAACGLVVVAPMGGTVRELSRVDSWSRLHDDPSTRGGRFVAIVGDDGVRYYLAHFSSVAQGINPGSRVKAGQPIGRIGSSGRAGGCHLHIGLSPPCTGRDWWVRRGVVAPYAVLRSWQRGIDASPASSVRVWTSTHPHACESPRAIGAT